MYILNVEDLSELPVRLIIQEHKFNENKGEDDILPDVEVSSYSKQIS